ncbi:MAG: HAD-IIA family hydrolase [Candidatus ainarchaeum sp.]|nr:HAD-IIA family hydrolase [Candidatus ainarchaeum sp.]
MIKTAIFDLDGTLFVGKTVVPGAAEALERLRLAGIKVFFLTNAGTRTREGVAHKLTNMGLQAVEEEVYCGSYLVAKYIAANFPRKKAFIVGEPGMAEELKAADVPVAEHADIVAVCLDRHLTYEKLAKAHRLLKKGAEFIASNKDHTFPTEHGSMPGAGSIVAALEFSSKKTAHVIGKPNPFAFEIMKKELGLNEEETVMVGDRLDTDVMFAKNAGIKSALVLTGISKKEEIKEKRITPDFVFPSVAELTLP